MPPNTRWQRVTKDQFTKVINYLTTLDYISWFEPPDFNYPYIYLFRGFDIGRVNYIPLDIVYEIAC